MINKKSYQKKQDNHLELVIDFGTRKIISQGFSRLVTIPKTALLNCGLQEASLVNLKLVQEDGTKYIKITPIYSTNQVEA